MAEVVNMPRLSDTMEEGTVAKWHKKVGDQVSEGDLLAEIETDKATMDFEAFQEGVLLHIGVEEGNTAPVDSILAILGEEGEDISNLLEGKQGASKEEKEEPESEEEKDTGSSKQQEEASSEEDEKPSQETGERESDQRLKASPLAKKMAEDRGIDLHQVKGTGDGGRIVKEDIENYTPDLEKASAQTQTARAQTGSGYEDVSVSQMRKTIAKRLAESKFSAPHFYLTIDIDMDGAIEARKALNALAESKISYNDLVIKAAAVSLQEHPAVNASWLGDKIRMNHDINIGVAVAVDEGLMVPVIRYANQKGLSTINNEVKTYAGQARNKKLPLEDMEGGTFAVSNLGMFGIEEFTAIINPPNSCIMAVGAIRQEPVVKEGAIVIGNRMKVTLSCDHRTVDGATGAAFLQTFKEIMEHPMKMLL